MANLLTIKNPDNELTRLPPLTLLDIVEFGNAIYVVAENSKSQVVILRQVAGGVRPRYAAVEDAEILKNVYSIFLHGL